MKLELTIQVEKDETPTEQLARGVEEAVDGDVDTANAMDEVKKDAEQALAEAGYESADVTFIEKV